MCNSVIRPATLADLKGIYDLEAAVGKYPYPLVVIRQHFDLGSVFFVADTGAHFASYVLGAFNPKSQIAHIVAVMTRTECRSKGLARQLGGQVISSLMEFNPLEFQAVVSPENAASQALFKSLGFSECKLEKDYYGGDEERLILRKSV